MCCFRDVELGAVPSPLLVLFLPPLLFPWALRSLSGDRVCVQQRAICCSSLSLMPACLRNFRTQLRNWNKSILDYHLIQVMRVTLPAADTARKQLSLEQAALRLLQKQKRQLFRRDTRKTGRPHIPKITQGQRESLGLWQPWQKTFQRPECINGQTVADIKALAFLFLFFLWNRFHYVSLTGQDLPMYSRLASNF